MGIVGLGQIGRAVMQRLKPFGVKRFVIWSRTCFKHNPLRLGSQTCTLFINVYRFLYSGRTKKEASWEEGAEFVPFEEILQQSDFVLVSEARQTWFCQNRNFELYLHNLYYIH